ncbi:uncharacterized protein C8Q71DRAFT_721944 [Rhodofomes roseus]|uniref:Uncharacterized protein n=1 Tax=Rhodofomes roseus TaxID=34475 RepID=A0ABQ8KQ13_9APHY|nr:uncharacterized protein C8Q71DRAFT_721944 [Rhodofomes roseus]KAH9840235.1 hypothetical protein C8Q71DRAFT_721944 [Rhodofomes roseus]
MVNSQAKCFECMPAEAYEGMTDDEILETFDQQLKTMEEKWTQLMVEANEEMIEEEILQNLDQRLMAMEEMWTQLTADAEDEVTNKETLQTLDECLAAMEEHLIILDTYIWKLCHSDRDLELDEVDCLHRTATKSKSTNKRKQMRARVQIPEVSNILENVKLEEKTSKKIRIPATQYVFSCSLCLSAHICITEKALALSKGEKPKSKPKSKLAKGKKHARAEVEDDTDSDERPAQRACLGLVNGDAHRVIGLLCCATRVMAVDGPAVDQPSSSAQPSQCRGDPTVYDTEDGQSLLSVPLDAYESELSEPEDEDDKDETQEAPVLSPAAQPSGSVSIKSYVVALLLFTAAKFQAANLMLHNVASVLQSEDLLPYRHGTIYVPTTIELVIHCKIYMGPQNFQFMICACDGCWVHGS